MRAEVERSRGVLPAFAGRAEALQQARALLVGSQQGAVLLAEAAELLLLAGRLPGRLPGHRLVLLQLGLQPPPGWTATTPLQATRV